MVGKKKDAYSSIRCRNSTKNKLKEIKIHKRETEEDVIVRLLEVYKRYQGAMVK